MARGISNEQFQRVVEANIGPGDLSEPNKRLAGKIKSEYGVSLSSVDKAAWKKGLSRLSRRLGVSIKTVADYLDFSDELIDVDKGWECVTKLAAAFQNEQERVRARIESATFQTMVIGASYLAIIMSYRLSELGDRVLFVSEDPVAPSRFSSRAMALNSSLRTSRKIAPLYNTTPIGEYIGGDTILDNISDSRDTKVVTCDDLTGRFYAPGARFGVALMVRQAMFMEHLLLGHKADVTGAIKRGDFAINSFVRLEPRFGQNRSALNAFYDNDLIVTPGLNEEQLVPMSEVLEDDRTDFDFRMRKAFEYYQTAVETSAIISRTGNVGQAAGLVSELSKLNAILDLRLPLVCTTTDLSKALLAWKLTCAGDYSRHPLANCYGRGAQECAIIGSGDGGKSFLEILNREGDQGLVYKKDTRPGKINWFVRDPKFVDPETNTVTPKSFDQAQRPRYQRNNYDGVTFREGQVSFIEAEGNGFVRVFSDKQTPVRVNQVFISIGVGSSLVSRIGQGELYRDSDGYVLGRKYPGNVRLIGAGAGLSLNDLSPQVVNIINELGVNNPNAVAAWVHASLALRDAYETVSDNLFDLDPDLYQKKS